MDAHALELDPLLGWSNTGMRALHEESRQRSWDLDEHKWAIESINGEAVLEIAPVGRGLYLCLLC